MPSCINMLSKYRSILRTSPFSTLLSNSPWQILCNYRPFLGSIFIHKLQDSIVFLFHPCTLHQIGIQNLLPSMQALHICSIRKMLRWKVILDTQVRSHMPTTAQHINIQQTNINTVQRNCMETLTNFLPVFSLEALHSSP